MRYILPLLLFVTIFAAAQKKQGQARLDSLLAEVPKLKEDTAGVMLLNVIGFDYRIIDPEEGLKYAGRGLSLAQKLSWRKGEGVAWNILGLNHQSKGDNPAALEAFFKALSINEALKNTSGIAKVCGNIGIVYYDKGDFARALEYYSKSLRMAEEAGDERAILGALVNIGNAYEEQKKYKEALEYKLRALKAAKAQDDQYGIALQMGNIGITYRSLKAYPLALAYEYKALALAGEMGDQQNVAINLGNIGGVYLSIAKDSVYTKPDSLVPAGKAANVAKAIEYLSKSIAVSREIDLKPAISDFSKRLSEAWFLQGDYKRALQAYEQYTAVKDSLYNTENNEKIANLETKRAIELKDKDIQIAKLAVAKKRNERWFFIAGIVLLLGIMAILFRSFRKQQHSNMLLSKEKKRSDDLLLNILPAEVAEELKESGASAAKQYEEVSVLFTDFVNFTVSSEELGAQVMVKELNECFTAFDAIIERNGLEKIKTIGDAYMAVCGLPLSDPFHAKKAVQAAIEIRDFIEERKKRERAFEIRIGINTGSVVAGIVGVKKFAYDIWGDTVNTAARMEQHSEPGNINISQSTYELVKGDYRCDYRGKIAAKNKGEVEMYFVESPVAQPA